MANQTGPPLSSYDFLAPRKIVFGWGRRQEIGALARPLGKRAFLVFGSRTLQHQGVGDEITRHLKAAGIEPVPVANLNREPEVADVDQTTTDLLALGAGEGDFLIAIGGGSAIDLAKASSAMSTNQESASVVDFLEGVGRGLALTRPPLPLLAMPTTAGTGTEATKNAVISSFDPPFKRSLRSDLMVPAVVLVDPELTVSLPPTTTAYTGMDAITQLIESYLSRRAKPIPQALCLQGLELAAGALAEAVEDGRSRTARERMSHAALLSGLALANSGLGLAHG
ncbi:MAG: iron-containing alcohol dehydrogenase, partial [Planctomycetes bacterium]|nr:iron-containing alcohol dehydrogenase [Planctomycetota bacterium]